MFAKKATLSWIAVILSCLFAGVPVLAQAPDAGICQQPVELAVADSLHRKLQSFDQELDLRLILFERNGWADSPRVIADVEERLEVLESELQALPGETQAQEAAGRLQNKLRMLKNRVGDLVTAAGLDAGHRPSPVQAGSRGRSRTLGAPPNDDCTAATVIGPGTFFGDTSQASNDGQTTCGASLFTPDVWYKLVFPQSGTLYMNTFGSSYDTVLSVHSYCPGTVANTLACDDDTSGLDSAVGVYAPAGGERWIRISGFGGATGAFTLDVGGGGEVAGLVTDAVTGDPLQNVRVELWDGDSYSVGSTVTGPGGDYALGDLAPGIYFATTRNYLGYLDELYDDLPCPGGGGYSGGCDPPDGTPILVGIDGSVTGIDFALVPGGTIAGQVIDASSGTAAAGVRVEIWDAAGSFVDSDYADGAGDYAVDGLAPGSYFASTDASAFADELYDDLPCPGGAPWGCDPTAGTPIEVEINATTAGIDFVLDRLGAIAGTVTEAVTADPLSSIRVEVWNASGSRLGFDNTDGDGVYSVGGLAGGTYYVVAEGYSSHADELYDDLPCPGGPPWGCDPVIGTPVEVETNQTVPGIDFVLDRLGAVSGTVIEAGSGDPISSIRVEIWSSSGDYVNSASTYGGAYHVDGLTAGTYFAVIDEDYTYASELYDELPCPGGAPYGCNPTTGTPIEVELNATTSEIDFELVRKGVITGTVTDQTSGYPIPDARVEVWTAGDSLAWSGYADQLGAYSTYGLAAGTYHAKADLFSSGYLEELYEELPCPLYGCQPSSGTPIEVADATMTSGIDFTLSQGGAVRGTVTERTTGDPITSGSVDLYDATGNRVAGGSLDGSGSYRAGGLPAGTYFARTDLPGGPWLEELYDDLPCPGGECLPATGTPIEVVLGETVEGIDFELERLGALSGTVTDAATGQPLSGGVVWVFDANGSWVDHDDLDASGRYTVEGLGAGTYFARADMSSNDYIDELYDDLPCVWSCQPTTGTPIEVAMGAVTENIDFALDRYGALAGLVTDAATGGPLAGVQIFVWDSGGSHVRSGTTDGMGLYTADRLLPGSYFATTESQDHDDELYDDLPCAGGCDPTQGTPIQVARSSTTRHVDFALDRSGSISGTVTHRLSGLPISGLTVRIWDATGAEAAETYTGEAGHYRAGGLQPGTYFATTESYEYLGLLYDGLPCGPGCAPASGTPIQVGAHTDTPGIDFRLSRLGSIAGTVVEEPAGGPLSGVWVEVWDQNGNYAGDAYTGPFGTFLVEGLYPGTHFAIAGGYDHLEELYDGRPCPYGDCDPTAGTSIPVALDATTGGIDFALERLGAISGRVVDAATGQPLSGIRVEIWDAGSRRVGSRTTDSAGNYTVGRLAPGIHYASTDNHRDYLDELYDDLPCLAGAPYGCDPDKGTPIPVVAAAATEGIDFGLIQATTGISGVVTVAATGTPLPNAIIDLWNSFGLHVASVVTGVSGAYYADLPPDTYFAATDHGSPALADEVFDSLLCPGPAYGGSCDPTAGTPIVVEDSDLVGVPGIATGIDFTLEPSIVLFRDGFESGSASAWSAVIGMP